MPDAYIDLTTLAAAQPPDPRIGPMLVKTAMVWSFPGCILDGVNLRLPRANVSDARVKAAIADGVWQAHEIDAAGQPIKAVPVASIWAGRPPFTPAEAWGPRSWPPQPAVTLSIFRGTPLVFVGPMTVQWLEGWRRGETPRLDGANLPDALLVAEMPAAFQASETHSPQVGDRLSANGQGVYQGAGSNQQYTVTAVRVVETRRFICTLARYVAPNG